MVEAESTQRLVNLVHMKWAFPKDFPTNRIYMIIFSDQLNM